MSKKELEELRALEAQEQTQDRGTGVQPRDEAFPTTDTDEAMIAGAISGVPSALIAAGQAVHDQMSTENSIETISESYNRNKSQLNDEIDKAKAKNPFAADVTDFAVSAVSMLGPNAMLKGASKAVKGVVAVGEAALSGFARADEPLSKDGLISTLGGGTIGLTIAGGVHLASKIPVAKAFAAMSRATKAVALGATTPNQRKALSSFLNKTGQGVDEFLDKMLKIKDKKGKMILNSGDTAGDMFEKLSIHGDELGEEVIQLASGMKDVKLSTADTYRRIKSQLIDPLLESPDIDMQKKGSRFLNDWLDPMSKNLETVQNNGVTSHVFTSFKENIPIDGALKLVKDMGRAMGQEIEDKATHQAMKLKTSELIYDVIRETALKEGKDPAMVGRLLKQSDKLHNITMVKQMLHRSMGKGGGDVLSKMQDIINVRAFTAREAGSAIGMNDFGATAFAATINSVLKSGKAPSAVAFGLDKMGKAAQMFPSHQMWNSLVVAAAGPAQGFRESLSSAIGKSTLLMNPLPRTVEAAKVNRSSLIAIVRESQGDKQADALNELFEHGSDDDIGGMMDTIVSQGPNEIKQYIEEGMGFDGKVYTPQDKQFFDENISTTQAPLAWKLQAKKNLRDTGAIPESPQEFIQAQDKLKIEDKQRHLFERSQGPRY